MWCTLYTQAHTSSSHPQVFGSDSGGISSNRKPETWLTRAHARTQRALRTYAGDDEHDEEGVHDGDDGLRQRRDDLRPATHARREGGSGLG
jgi:hypothetical protein